LLQLKCAYVDTLLATEITTETLEIIDAHFTHLTGCFANPCISTTPNRDFPEKLTFNNVEKLTFNNVKKRQMVPVQMLACITDAVITSLQY